MIDTAGVRRRARVSEVVEKFSVIKTLQAIEQSHVAVLVLDAQQGVSDQDASLLGLIVDSGRALAIAVNKWDHLDADTRTQVKRDLDRRLGFLDFAKIHFISALHGTGVGELLGSVRQAYAAATRKLATPELTRILEAALAAHHRPWCMATALTALCASGGTKSTTDHYPRQPDRPYAGNLPALFGQCLSQTVGSVGDADPR